MRGRSLVSVLDLDSIMLAGRTRDARRTAGISMKLMCISLNDVIDVRLDGEEPEGALRSNRYGWWSLGGSNS